MNIMDKKILEEILKTTPITFSSSETSSSSSEEDSDVEDIRRLKTRTLNFFEHTVPEYSESCFKSHFRLTRNSVKRLCDEIEISKNYVGGWPEVSEDKSVHITLWYLANTETFRQVADRFNVTLSSCYNSITLIVNCLVEKSAKYIKWPSTQEYPEIAAEFEKKKGLPFVTGAIDGSHIIINRPKNNEGDYVNRKGFHSILLQGIVNHKKIFTDIYVGEPGSIHDSRLLRKSPLYEKAINDPLLFGQYYLLGDSAYPSTLNWIVPPFKDNGHLSANQKDFNYKISATRIVVENAFSLLKGRFRRVARFENRDIKFIINSLVAAIVLHNLCIMWDDFGEEFSFEENNLMEDIVIADEENFLQNLTRRNEIYDQLYN